MANNYDVGDLAQITAEFTDDAGAYLDPTDVYCAYTDPSGNVTTLHYGVDLALTRSSAGHYVIAINVDEVGTWLYHWYSTGTGQASEFSYFTATLGATVAPASQSCLEYMTVTDLRAEFGDAVAGDSDAVLQKRIDTVTSFLETLLGQTFGRALVAQSTAADSVVVTSTALILGGTSFTFAAYPTLDQLIYAVNTSGHNFSLTRLPQVRSDTPSTLLKTINAATCGPTYDKRVVLCLSALYCKLSGNCQSHLFLPLNISSIVSVTENTLALTTSDYWAVAGESWLIRKLCACTTTCSCAPRGHWSAYYPGNIAVTYVPQVWGQVPPVVSGQILEAYRARYDLSGLSSESFGEYKYTRNQPKAEPWQNIIGGNGVRQYGVKFQP